MTKQRVNKKFKDSVFRMIFREKKELLSLYTAMNGSDYQDPEQLEINTLEDVVYMGIKNDTSFILDDDLNLYEAQSSVNPNMPLRGVFYFSNLLKGYVEKNRLDIYSKKQLALPTPRFVVFYNGQQQQEERKIQRLSDSFIKKNGTEEPSLECTALFLNINYGYNKALMEKCRKLYEYSYFVEVIRKQQKSGCSMEEAINQAIQICIDQKILEDFLRKHRGEVLDVILTEYDAERHIQDEKQLSFQEGEKAGLERGEKIGLERGEKIGLERGSIIGFIEGYHELGIPKDQTIAKLIEKFSITEEDAKDYLKQYW